MRKPHHRKKVGPEVPVIIYKGYIETQTAFSTTQKQILTCDQPGYPSCYSTGYSPGLLNTRISCSSMLLNSTATSSQVDNYCLGYRVAAQHMLQQQQKFGIPAPVR
jgi:hypothetical protein